VRPGWALGVMSLWFVACLNPMPEEFPYGGDGDSEAVVVPGASEENPVNQGAAGTASPGSNPEVPDFSGEGGAAGAAGQGADDAGAPDAGAAPADAECEGVDGGS
jgi:hypothetical protein